MLSLRYITVTPSQGTRVTMCLILVKISNKDTTVGKALSCFTLEGKTDTVCVAFHGRCKINNDGEDVIHYLTFNYKTGGIMDDKVLGVHHCGFQEGT